MHLQRLHQVADYGSPFDNRTSGFNQPWWKDRPRRIAELVHSYAVRLDDTEADIVRIEVDPDYQAGPYVGRRQTGPVACILLIEVRRDWQLKGVGTEAVSLILQQYSEQDVLAAPKRSAAFWIQAGWARVGRVDNDDCYPDHYSPSVR